MAPGVLPPSFRVDTGGDAAARRLRDAAFTTPGVRDVVTEAVTAPDREGSPGTTR